MRAKFDPSRLDQARTLAIELANKVKATKNHEDAWDCGEALRNTKELTPHGQVGLWLINDFPYTPQHARRYMKLATIGWEGIIGFDSLRSALDSIRTTREPKPTRSDKVAESSIADLKATVARLVADNEQPRHRLHNKTTRPPPPVSSWTPPEEEEPPPDEHEDEFLA